MRREPDIQDIRLSEGMKLKMLTGDTFISVSGGIFQVNMLATEARKIGQAFIAAADRLEARAVAGLGGQHG